ncbi:MAG: glucose-1-phosphate thymidylyltransferase RfbA [Candidatus Neomarinimicrobiota bacterium]|nr:glucose-1-phosphate thymidylyltransferase RfbA [Candidatus Neomarinimicrobiota bacterium]
MKGIILAGGYGTRLYPSTKAISKQLIPIYDKPMIYYPLSMLMLAGIREVLIISTEEDIPKYKLLLSDGKSLGMKFSYKIQPSPNGLAEAFIIGEDFIGNDNVCLILGDNIFYGNDLPEKLRNAAAEVNASNNAVVFSYFVNDPQRYGVIEFDSDDNAISIEEKPSSPKSNYAVSGLYFYPNDVIEIAKNQKPSERGELEITDTNKSYLTKGQLKVEKMARGYTWLDTGTHESLLEASQFVQILEKRQGVKISCIEEIAYRMGFIQKNDLLKLGEKMKNNSYGKYLIRLVNDLNS